MSPQTGVSTQYEEKIMNNVSDRSRIIIGVWLLLIAPWSSGATFSGRITGADDSPVVGAMVTFRYSIPFQERTVFSDATGRYRITGLPSGAEHFVRVRRIGWQDIRHQDVTSGASDSVLDFVMTRLDDPRQIADQLPANQWYQLALERIESEHHREQFVRQCTYCHQQGNAATRLQRDPEEWRKVLALMARMGAGLDEDLRLMLPELLNTAYDPATAVPRLTEGYDRPGFAPPPSEVVRRAVVDEFQLGGRSSMQHDMITHPNGDIYSVDMSTDTLYRLDPSVPGGVREWYKIPSEQTPLGGLAGSAALPPNSDMRVGPHSLQVGGDGAVWITLATGNQLARFDPVDKSFLIEDLPGGIYPHTLRIDDKGRVWYTIAVSNHVGMFDPATGQHETIRVPARGFGEEVMLRMLPVFLWLSQYVDLGGGGGGEGSSLPVPYGIDIGPDGRVWFSQLNAHRIGVIDPESFDLTMIDTPFTAPRRMRFDSKGNLWIPGFSSNVLARFDPRDGSFKTMALPIEPLGTETPYALNVDRSTDTVWICGTNSDTLIRYQPQTDQFTVYPMPTRVTYTRDIDFGSDGSIWTSNSNAPAWQIETGVPRVIRLYPDGVDELSDSPVIAITDQ
jgi:virginiamycin B lyase